MNERLRAHIEALFADVPYDRRIEDLKEELLSNLTDKYEDMIANGRSDEAAFTAAISGIGDIDELLRYVTTTKEREEAATPANQMGAKVLLASAVALITMVISFFLCLLLRFPFWLGAGFSASVGVFAAGLFLTYRIGSSNTQREATLVESLLANRPNGKVREIRKSVTGIIWTLAPAIFLLVGFSTQQWHIAWLIFVATAFMQQITAIALDFLSGGTSGINLKGRAVAALWLMIVILYFLISFATNAWTYSWIIFIIGAALTQVLRLVVSLMTDGARRGM